jgi:hypothetical protein
MPTNIILSWSAPAANISTAPDPLGPWQFFAAVAGTNITIPITSPAQYFTADVPLFIAPR